LYLERIIFLIKKYFISLREMKGEAKIVLGLLDQFQMIKIKHSNMFTFSDICTIIFRALAFPVHQPEVINFWNHHYVICNSQYLAKNSPYNLSLYLGMHPINVLMQ